MTCIAIDPGNEESAMIVWNGSRVELTRYGPNDDIIRWLRSWNHGPVRVPLVIEKIASYGMPVGAEIFETCVWTGRFMEAYGAEHTHRLTRNEVKNNLCHSSKAKDGNVRQAILDRFGGKEKAIGKKAQPGPFYGIAGDMWSALAVAITWLDRQNACGGREVA